MKGFSSPWLLNPLFLNRNYTTSRLGRTVCHIHALSTSYCQPQDPHQGQHKRAFPPCTTPSTSEPITRKRNYCTTSASAMTSKLVPQNPAEVMVIRKLTPNITTLSVPFLRFGRIRIGGRATIVRLTSGSLAVFSPVALTSDVKAEVQSLGNDVKYLIAPDIEHHIFLSDWHTQYPKAHVIGPEGLPEKRAADNSITYKVPFSTVFTAKDKRNITVSEDFDRDFDYEYVDSHANKELVFLYKPDKALIEADYMFNLPATEQYSRTGESPTKGLLTKLFVALNSTQGKAIWHKRLLWYAFASKPGYITSTKKIATWDFDMLIPCHGDVIEKGAKGVFNKIFEWHLAAQDK